jgi:thioredoxin reductase (NADPH)
MAEALAPLAAEFGATVKLVDVDAAPALEAKYDELVPVLLHGETELCHYFLDAAKTREYLAGIR